MSRPIFHSLSTPASPSGGALLLLGRGPSHQSEKRRVRGGLKFIAPGAVSKDPYYCTRGCIRLIVVQLDVQLRSLHEEKRTRSLHEEKRTPSLVGVRDVRGPENDAVDRRGKAARATPDPC